MLYKLLLLATMLRAAAHPAVQPAAWKWYELLVIKEVIDRTQTSPVMSAQDPDMLSDSCITDCSLMSGSALFTKCADMSML